MNGSGFSLMTLLQTMTLSETLYFVWRVISQLILPIVLVPALCVSVVAWVRRGKGFFRLESSLAMMFCLIGGTLGFAAGFSRSPVVDVALTASVSLVVTLLGYSFVIKKDVNEGVRHAVPTALLGFVLTLWIALLVATAFRFEWQAMIA
ncbi:hypothetical protein BGP77_17040 [Saccharospirillum sp. MSK14-1]|uniref:hypothetical protein n=1 Tax=Saccharospirillum sp. MSK14-1 TaxID=1897632 RepID=UPI000D3D8F9B|nr:hypothetical protein [Saccharospirillum sp. MSK14-1]PTY38151.1 hypothetical protein BGP77_17040 [Saccharospirillum sp. MSK14-1]